MPKFNEDNIREYALSIRLTKGFLEARGTVINVCRGCGRWLTDDEYKKHLETRCT